MLWHVDPNKAVQLNLRQSPIKGSVIATLPQGAEVEKVSEYGPAPIWWMIRTNLSGQIITGYLHSGYLREGPGTHPPSLASGPIPESHLRTKNSRRIDDFGRAFPLDEADMPIRDGASSGARSVQLIEIIDFLNPEDVSHKRYVATGGKTFCNIYAYDFCSLARVYLPRVWWTEAALQSIRAGEAPAVLYGNTVRELNANALHDWFLDFGSVFGWRRVFDADLLQQETNSGAVCIIVAKRANVARSGHVAAVAPEHRGINAARNGGKVTRPVLSQAGATNWRAKAPTQAWWADASSFQSFGFWVHV